MQLALTGATGFVGRHVIRLAVRRGFEVVAFTRDPSQPVGDCIETRKFSTTEPPDLRGCDAVIHLAGENVAGLWTRAKMHRIRDSRVLGTRTLARAIAGLDPQPVVFVSGSAIGYYGDTGDEPVDESSPAGDGFLAHVVAAWEASAAPALEAGIRVVHPRTGLVVAGSGGAWGRLWPLFRFGLGGRLGGGSQYWSFVSLRDEVRAIRRMIDDSSMSGAYNVTAPTPATNAEITTAMSELLHRPAFAHVPRFVLKTVLGEMSQEVLGSARVLPSRLLEAGFAFDDPTIGDALRTARPELVKD